MVADMLCDELMWPPQERCKRCRELESAQKQAIDECVAVISERWLFGQGRRRWVNAFTATVHRLHAQRAAAVEALLNHQAEHWRASEALQEVSALCEEAAIP